MDDIAEIEEKAENVVGWFNENYVIASSIDDTIKRFYCVYNLYNLDNPADTAFVYIPQPNAKREISQKAINSTLNVLKRVSGRSRHFPHYKFSGYIKKLAFGSDACVEDERDPEWTNRPYIIVHHEHVLLYSLFSFSENGCLPTDLALHAGLGIAYCLAALHRAGFVHRLVSPHSFSYPVPLTLDLISSRMIITDMSLCHPIPYPHGPRVTAPFEGCLRYSSTRAHSHREQGPSDDYISLIYVVAEMISGKLSWRSIRDQTLIHEAKKVFEEHQEFKRLPRELRKLHRDLISKPLEMINSEDVIKAFKDAITRRDPNKSYELPKWLIMPSAN